MMECEYSIIICTRNRCQILKRVLALHATLDRIYTASREYIIVDNGSTDATPEVVAEFRQLVDCPVHYVLETQPGHSIALNAGCRFAHGNKFVFTDDDTLPATTWFHSIHEMFTSKGADWVFGPVVPRWEFGPAPTWYGPPTSMFVACLSLGDEVLVDRELTGCFVGANHACKRSRIFELGLYDLSLGIRGDGLSYAGNDDDLFRRGRESGFKIVYSPKAIVEHLIAKHRYNKSTHREMFRMTGRNEFQKMLRSPPPYPLILGVPRFYLSHLFTHMRSFVSAFVARQKPQAFYHETQIQRFVSLFISAIRHRVFK